MEHNATIESNTVLYYINDYIFETVQMGYGDDYVHRHPIDKLCLLQDITFNLPNTTRIVYKRQLYALVTADTDLIAFDKIKNNESIPRLVLPKGTLVSQSNGIVIQLIKDLEILLTTSTPIKLHKGNKLINDDMENYGHFGTSIENAALIELEEEVKINIYYYNKFVQDNSHNVRSKYIDRPV
jgi:hypothetical protein